MTAWWRAAGGVRQVSRQFCAAVPPPAGEEEREREEYEVGSLPRKLSPCTGVSYHLVSACWTVAARAAYGLERRASGGSTQP